MYDTSSLEAQLARQEEEWAAQQRARANNAETEEAEEEDVLQLSAHSSADDSDSDSESDGGGSSSHTSAEGADRRKTNRKKKPSDRDRHIHKKKETDGEKKATAVIDEVAAFLPRDAVSGEQLAETARLLLRRFEAFAVANPKVKGIAKLLRRAEKEVKMAEESAARDALIAEAAAASLTSLSSSSPLPSAANNRGAAPTSATGSSNTAKARAVLPPHLRHLDDGRQPYERCNSLVLFEVLLACIENEQGVVSVLETEQMKSPPPPPPPCGPSSSSKNASGGGGSGKKGGAAPPPTWSRLSVEIDVVSQNGGRWLRVKGTSLKNLESDFEGNSDRKPFVSTATNFAMAARHHLLPFGRHPSTAIILSELPEAEVGMGMADGDVGAAPPSSASASPRLAALRKTVMSALCGDAGIDHVVPYYSKALVAEVAAQRGMYVLDGDGDASDDAAALRWAASLAPEAVEERLAALKRLWPLLGRPTSSASEEVPPATAAANGAGCNLPPSCGLLPSTLPLSAVPRLVNFDVTALVAMCSDTCHAFDQSTAALLDAFVVLRRQVDDERRTQTLEEHLYPLLDRMTVTDAREDAEMCENGKEDEERTPTSASSSHPKGCWWRREWGRFDPIAGGLCPLPSAPLSKASAPTASKAKTKQQHGRFPSHLPPHLDIKYPFTHDRLVAYIDGIAAEAEAAAEAARSRGHCSPSSSSTPSTAASQAAAVRKKKPSDIIWSPEQHAAERQKDAEFPHRLNWIMSDVALAEFSWILRTISGPMELPRAEYLLKHIHVIPTEHFVYVELDPIFSTEEESATQRKERRRNDEKAQRREYQSQQEAQRRAALEAAEGAFGPTVAAMLYAGTSIPKGMNRTSVLALEAAARAAAEAKRLRDAEASPDGSTTSAALASAAAADHDAEATVVSSAADEANEVGVNVNVEGGEAAEEEVEQPSLFSRLPSHVLRLECTGKIKARHKAVFGIGDALRATTATANEQFLKAALEQNIALDTAVHHSRALVGKKVAAGLRAAAAAEAEALALVAAGGEIAASATGAAAGDGPAVVWK